MASKRTYAATSAALAVGLAAVVLRDVYADWILQGKPLWSTLVENSAPLVLALVVLGSGYWLYRNRDRRYVATVARWQLVGAAGIFALVGWVIGLQIVQGQLKPYVIVVQTTIGGAVAGTMIGYANARTGETLARAERERDRFRALFDNATSGIVEVETQGGDPVIREANPAFEPAVDDGTPLFDAVDHDEEDRESIREALLGGDALETSVTTDAPDGRRHFEVRVVPFEGGDRAYVIYTDVTELRDAQRELEQSVARLERSNERLEEFAYVASHDLQEPLRTVSRYVEIIEEELGDDIDDDVAEFMDTVVTGTERMGSMVSGLLDYSRVTTRGGEFEPVDVEALVEDVVDDLELLCAENEGTVRVDSLPTVEADPDQLWQVFQNLIKNALEHSGEAPVTVSVSATETDDGYEFAVEDDGPGIDPHVQDGVFEMFESGESYHTTGEARGIGLAVVERIVDRHGGEIHVESEPGEGSRFVFTIPR